MPPPVDSGGTWSRPRYSRTRPDAYDPPTADRDPPVIPYEVLSRLPMAVQVAVTAALLPYEAAVTSVMILKNAEALLGEMVFHMRALRPATASVSQAYADGHFDPLFKTFDQIQHGTSAIGLIWAPFSAVRDVVAPGQARRELVGRRTEPPPPPPPASPSVVEWLGGLSGQVLDQAGTLPGAGLLARTLGRPDAGEPAVAEPAPDARAAGRRPDAMAFVVDDPRRPAFESPAEPPSDVRPGTGLPPLLDRAGPLFDRAGPLVDRAAPLVPGAIRRLFGG
ncbi:MAG TPA: hypothetical protein VGH99_07200 [Pseudonocardia sp.]|jgi:hypothetical protein